MWALKIYTWRVRRASRFRGYSNTVISPISVKRKSGPLKEYEGPQNMRIRAQMALATFPYFNPCKLTIDLGRKNSEFVYFYR